MSGAGEANPRRWSQAEAALHLAEIRSDPELLERFRLAYSGEGDAHDELEWFVDPGAVSPTGATNPSDQIANMQKLAYGPNDDTRGSRVQAERALESLLERRSRNQLAVSDALSILAEPALEDAKHARLITEELVVLNVLPRPRRFFRRNTGLAVGLAAIIAAGIVVQAVTPAPLSLEVFGRAQKPAELALERSLVGEYQLNSGSVRILAVQGGTSLLSFTSAQGILPAIAGLETACLVVEKSARFYATGCIAIEELKSTGFQGTVDVEGMVYQYSWGPRGGASIAEAPSVPPG